MLRLCLGLLHQTQETPFALPEPLLDGLDRVLRELFILNHKVMQVIPEVVGTSRSSMPIKYSEKADLRPLNIDISLNYTNIDK